MFFPPPSSIISSTPTPSTMPHPASLNISALQQCQLSQLIFFPTHFPVCSVLCLPHLANFCSSFKFHFLFIFHDLPRKCYFSFDTLIDLYPLFCYMHCMLLFSSLDLLFHFLHSVGCMGSQVE